jgi:UDP-GlcNAc:undecaprenyl-phosphate/decaprenyl-phosphate GlcNAc-1-phosphate transferase
MLFFVLGCVAPAFLLSFGGTFMVRRFAPMWGLVDQPGKRKVHTEPKPLGGGIAIWLGVVVPVLVIQIAAYLLTRTDAVPGWIPERVAIHLDGVLYRSGQMWAVLGAGTVLAVMGLWDDSKNLPWLPRLVVQLGLAFGLVFCGVRATVFVPAPWIGAVVSAVWIVVLVNAFNFLDNMDGLSSGIALVASIVFAVIMLTVSNEPHWLVGGVMLVLAGSLLGFLCHNWPPAKIFMGDSGSYFIGLLLACLTVLGTFYESGHSGRHVILAPLFVLAIPLYDFSSVMLIRLREGRSPFHPDKSHFSHRLVELGLSPRNAVLTIHLATLTTGLGGILLFQLSDWSGAFLVVALIACVLAIVAILETVGRRSNGDS